MKYASWLFVSVLWSLEQAAYSFYLPLVPGACFLLTCIYPLVPGACFLLTCIYPLVPGTGRLFLATVLWSLEPAAVVTCICPLVDETCRLVTCMCHLVDETWCLIPCVCPLVPGTCSLFLACRLVPGTCCPVTLMKTNCRDFSSVFTFLCSMRSGIL
jgi:hypothetical protein